MKHIIPPFISQSITQITGVRSGVDDAQHLRLFRQTHRQFSIIQLAQTFHSNTLQVRKHRVRALHDFTDGIQATLEPGFDAHLRLCRRTQHNGRCVQAGQFLQSGEAGTKKPHRQGLRLIQNNYAAGDVVQFATARGSSGKKRLEELYGSGYNNRRIPVFPCQCRQIFQCVSVFRGFGLILPTHIAVMFHNSVRQFFSKSFTKNVGCLFNDAGIGDHIDDAAQSVFFSVFHGKRQRREGLAAARRHSEGKNALRRYSCITAIVQHFGPIFIDWQFCRACYLFRQMGVQPFVQQRQGRIAAALFISLWFHKGFCIKKIRIHETGIKHLAP
nr:hypothetical protein [Candidatus Desulfovibrio trichonymphae]